MSGPEVAAVIGAGRTGRALGRLLARAGVRVGAVSCRTAERAEEARAFVGAERAETSPAAAARGADLVLVCVPDGAIAGVAAGLRVARGTVVAHTAGALGSEELAGVEGAECGSAHPLRSFADPARAAESFAGTACAVEGSEAAVAVLTAVVRRIGGVPLPVKPGAKALYHAGAVFASNYVVTLLSVAEMLFDRSGIPPEAGLPALTGLAEGVVSNVRRLGPVQALTGPVERGDVETIVRHVEALRSREIPLDKLYGDLGVHTAGLAAVKGGHDPVQWGARILAALKGERA